MRRSEPTPSPNRTARLAPALTDEVDFSKTPTFGGLTHGELADKWYNTATGWAWDPQPKARNFYRDHYAPIRDKPVRLLCEVQIILPEILSGREKSHWLYMWKRAPDVSSIWNNLKGKHYGDSSKMHKA